MTAQTPSSLVEPKSHPQSRYELFSLDERDDRFQEISTDFIGAGLRVTKVEILKNQHLWTRYTTEQKLILDHRVKIDSSFKLNEKFLYHGTSVDKSKICDEGLDSRMSKEGCFGKGIYFSDSPRKCVKYANRGSGTESYILLVRVILGDAKIFGKGQKARHLLREPEREEPLNGHRYYDSVEGCPVNHKEFVIYEGRRALVEGFITFCDPKLQPQECKEYTLNRISSSVRPKPRNIANRAGNAGSDSDSSDEEEDKGIPIDNSTSDSDDDVGRNFKRKDRDADFFRTAGTSNLTVEQVLSKSRDIFREETGVRDQLEIERHLLRGNMDVRRAIQIYKECAKKELNESKPERKEAAKAEEHPLPNTDGWNRLSKEDQEAFLEGQITDFLTVTGLDPHERDLARKYLMAVDMNLDVAVLAYFEEME